MLIQSKGSFAIIQPVYLDSQNVEIERKKRWGDPGRVESWVHHKISSLIYIVLKLGGIKNNLLETNH